MAGLVVPGIKNAFVVVPFSMAEVFISYSRKDKEFVRRLDEALKRRGREAWVDWEGVRPTEEFMQAIYGAIEGADTVIFVLTPDSLTSVVCGREIAHAVSHKQADRTARRARREYRNGAGSAGEAELDLLPAHR